MEISNRGVTGDMYINMFERSRDSPRRCKIYFMFLCRVSLPDGSNAVVVKCSPFQTQKCLRMQDALDCREERESPERCKLQLSVEALCGIVSLEEN